MNKRISTIRSMITALQALVNSVDIRESTKGGIDQLLQIINTELDGLDTHCNGVNVSGPINETRDRSVNIVRFKQFTLYTTTAEIDVNGHHSKLPNLEFHILYNLAINNGRIVRFKPTSSFNTHISVLRRSHPELKNIIEHVKTGETGCYRLNATAI